jgi:hypothetical protein
MNLVAVMRAPEGKKPVPLEHVHKALTDKDLNEKKDEVPAWLKKKMKKAQQAREQALKLGDEPPPEDQEDLGVLQSFASQLEPGAGGGEAWQSEMNAVQVQQKTNSKGFRRMPSFDPVFDVNLSQADLLPAEECTSPTGGDNAAKKANKPFYEKWKEMRQYARDTHTKFDREILFEKDIIQLCPMVPMKNKPSLHMQEEQARQIMEDSLSSYYEKNSTEVQMVQTIRSLRKTLSRCHKVLKEEKEIPATQRQSSKVPPNEHPVLRTIKAREEICNYVKDCEVDRQRASNCVKRLHSEVTMLRDALQKHMENGGTEMPVNFPVSMDSPEYVASQGVGMAPNKAKRLSYSETIVDQVFESEGQTVGRRHSLLVQHRATGEAPAGPRDYEPADEFIHANRGVGQTIPEDEVPRLAEKPGGQYAVLLQKHGLLPMDYFPPEPESQPPEPLPTPFDEQFTDGHNLRFAGIARPNAGVSVKPSEPGGGPEGEMALLDEFSAFREAQNKVRREMDV